MRYGQRLVGVELHARRPGQAASFYAWLLGAASGEEPGSWMPVTLLFEHAVCGVHATTWQGPPASWVPVVAVRDPAATWRRAADEGMGRVDLGDRSYLVDRRGAWMRLVDADDLPLDIDPDALGNTTVELNVPDPRQTMATYARVLDLEIVEMVDDATGYQMLLDDGVLALGGLWYEPQVGRALPLGWIPYFDVPDLVGTVASAEDEGVQVVLPPTVEEFDLFSVLVDTWGLAFGFYTYRYRGQAELFVRRDDGEVLAYRDAVRPLVSAPQRSGAPHP